MTIIIGIDPGSINTGYGIIRKIGSRLEHLASGVISIKGSDINSRLPIIFTRLHEILQQYQPDHMVIEQVFLADNPQSAIKLGMARGVAILAGSLCQCVIFELSARQAKKFVTGMGNAQKEQVNRMVCRMLGLQDPPRLDASDALALAISHAQTINTRLLLAAKSQALINNHAQRRLEQNTANHQVLSAMVEQFAGEKESSSDTTELSLVAAETCSTNLTDELRQPQAFEMSSELAYEDAPTPADISAPDRTSSTLSTEIQSASLNTDFDAETSNENEETSNEATTSRQISDESLNFTSDLIATISQQLTEQRQATWEDELRSGAGYHRSWIEEEFTTEAITPLFTEPFSRTTSAPRYPHEETTVHIPEFPVVVNYEANTSAELNPAPLTTAPDSLPDDSQTVLAALINSDLTQFAPLAQTPPELVRELSSARQATATSYYACAPNLGTTAQGAPLHSTLPQANQLGMRGQGMSARGMQGIQAHNAAPHHFTSKAQLRALVQSQFGKINGSQLSSSNKLSAFTRTASKSPTPTNHSKVTTQAVTQATPAITAESAQATSSQTTTSMANHIPTSQSSDYELLRHTQQLQSKLTPFSQVAQESHAGAKTAHAQQPANSVNRVDVANQSSSNNEGNTSTNTSISTNPSSTPSSRAQHSLTQLMHELTSQSVDKVLQNLEGSSSNNAATTLANINATQSAELLELDRASLSNFKINAKRFQVKTGKSSNRSKLETKIKKSRKSES